jgi:hypothetical protein
MNNPTFKQPKKSLFSIEIIKDNKDGGESSGGESISGHDARSPEPGSTPGNIASAKLPNQGGFS